MSSLATDVRNMNNRLLALEAERIKVRSSIMLGQLAYAIDDAATLYVFGSGQGHPTVRDIEKDAEAEASDLTDEEQQRWTEFKLFLHRKHWDVDRLKTLYQAAADCADGRTRGASQRDIRKPAAVGHRQAGSARSVTRE